MAAYSFSPISDIKDITEAHARRGFKVMVVGMAWKSVQTLTKTMGIPASKDQAMMVSSLARQIYEAGKKGVDLFAQPTLVIVGDDGHLDEAAVAWSRIQEAAKGSPSEVVFAHLSV